MLLDIPLTGINTRAMERKVIKQKEQSHIKRIKRTRLHLDAYIQRPGRAASLPDRYAFLKIFIVGILESTGAKTA
jgi:hypothetical protein